MVHAKALRYVTVPANRIVCFKNTPELIQMNLVPTQQLSFWAQKSRPVVQPLKFRKSFFAVDAVLIAIPSH
jgi:hypothetical protein